MAEHWDAIIIGAGFGGLCSGALLTKSGKKVLVLEKDGAIGGRAKSLGYQGHVLDDGAHVPTRPGHLEGIFAELKINYPKLIPIKNSEIFHAGRWQGARELYDAKLFKRALQEIARIPESELSRLDDVPLDEWVESISPDPGLKDVFFYLACSSIVGNRLATYSAGEMIYVVKEILKTGLRLSEMAGFIQGGTASLLKPLADFIGTQGGEVRLNTPVERVVIDKGRAVGVTVESGKRLFHSQLLGLETLTADYILVTAPLWDIFTLLDEDDFPSWWVDWVRWISSKVSLVLSNIYAVDKPLFDLATFRWAPQLPHSGMAGVFIHMPTYGEAARQYQFHALYQGHYDEFPDFFKRREAKERKRIRAALELLERDTLALFPELEHNYHWKFPHAEIYNIAQAPGLVGSKRPAMRPPGVKNLYLVSYTSAEARGVGMQATALCARAAAQAIMKS